MGVSRSPAEFAGKLRNAEKALKDAPSIAVVKGAQVARNAFLAAPGAPHKVAGRATNVTTKQLVGGDSPVVSVRWTGPAHLVNNPTKPHDIYPRSFVGTRGRGTRARKGAGLLAAFGLNAHKTGAGAGAVRLANGNVRAHVRHPGTHGKKFAQVGIALGAKLAATEMRNVTVSEFAKSFR